MVLLERAHLWILVHFGAVLSVKNLELSCYILLLLHDLSNIDDILSLHRGIEAKDYSWVRLEPSDVVKRSWPHIDVSVLSKVEVWVDFPVGALGLVFFTVAKRASDIMKKEHLASGANRNFQPD